MIVFIERIRNQKVYIISDRYQLLVHIGISVKSLIRASLKATITCKYSVSPKGWYPGAPPSFSIAPPPFSNAPHHLVLLPHPLVLLPIL